MGTAQLRRAVPAATGTGGPSGTGRSARWRFRPFGRLSPRGRSVLVTIGLAVSVDLVLGLVAAETFAGLPAAFWVMAVLAVAVDAKPYVVADRRASSVILPSICFTFAIALAWGVVPALAVQILAVAVAGTRMRRPLPRAVHLMVQHGVALGAAAAVAALSGLNGDGSGFSGGDLPGADLSGAGLSAGWDDALVIVGAALAWMAARYGLAAFVAHWRSERRARPVRHVELFATAALLLLGPVVLAAATGGPALVPLVLLALLAVHRMVRAAGESERAGRVDALTGLPNRRALQVSVVERGLGRGLHRPERQLALLLLDIDRFRTVNDALGHTLGDRLLIEVAHRLADVVPPHDLVVRLGGDEFAVLATRVDGPAAARRIAGHLAEALSRPFTLDGTAVDVSASIGIAVQSDRASDGPALLRQAEAAMYDAKQRGDQIVVYGPDAAHHSPDRLSLLADLRHALQPNANGRDGNGRDGNGRDGNGRDGNGRDGNGRSRDGNGRGRDGRGRDGRDGNGDGDNGDGNGRDDHGRRDRDGGSDDKGDGITLFYQPQIAIATGEIVGVEALLRWRHPSRGPVGPEELIRVVEHTPVMRLLTNRVLEEVITQLGQWVAEGRAIRASVNVSVRDLHAGDIADRIAALLHDHGVPAALLQLEITESALMADPHRVLTTITRLDRMGVAISLDDFGTGYSSLQHLRRLPLAEVKIDRSFVLGMTTDHSDAAIVGSIIGLAAALGLRVVAEGVEDERTWRALAAAGCHAAQGWFHARPMPAADLAVWRSRYRPVSPVPS